MIGLVEYQVEFRPRNAGPEIDDALVASAPRLDRFELVEALHRPTILRATFVADEPEFPYSALGRASVDFTMSRGEEVRAFRFFVERVRYLGTFGGGTHFEVLAASALSLLGEHRRSRIFMDATPLEILSDVLKPLSDRFDLVVDTGGVAAQLPVLDYCVQYRESDLEFVLRLLADHGVTIREMLAEGRPTLVCSDDNQAFPAAGDGGERQIPVIHDQPDLGDEESIVAFEIDRSVVPAQTHHTHWSWNPDPERITSSASATTDVFHDGTRDEHGFRRVPERDGVADFDEDLLVTRRHEQHAIDLEAANAECNVLGLEAGSTFDLISHPFADLNRRWLVGRVAHSGFVPHAGRASSGESRDANYRNTARCTPATTPFRPVVPTPRPHIYGLQTATVTGPPGEEIHTDQFGRVRVRMQWDRGESADEESCCWLRVAQSWAGPGFGTVFLPRVGMEVIVSFLDGDPDRPLVTGCVYNGANTAPYPLPDEKTKSSIKTSSSPGGEGFNELTFEDAAGSEEVFLHAQRDLRQVIKSAHSQSVGATQSVSVGSDQTTSVGGNRTQTVTGTEAITVTGTPEGPPPAAARSVTIQTGAHNIVVADGAMLIDASESITLKCGQSMVMVTPSGIALQAADGAAVELSTLLKMQAKTAATTLTMDANGRAELAGTRGKLELDDNVALTRGDTNGLWLEGSARMCADGEAEIQLDENAALSGAKVEVTGNGAGVILDQARATVSGGQAVQVAVNDQNGVSISAADIKVQGVAAEVGGQTVTVAGKLVRIN